MSLYRVERMRAFRLLVSLKAHVYFKLSRGVIMKIKSNEELIEIVGEALLWDIAGEYITTDIEHLKEALLTLGYIEHNDVEKITSANHRDSDEFIINEFSEKDGVLIVKFEMPSGIIAKSDNEEVCFRVTTNCTGMIEIPDIDSYNWSSIDFTDLSRPEILSYSHLVKMIRLSYEDIEADNINA